ncbi:MAG: GldG family protein [Proteobacteria bacterium]|nr:GldG family protein [Pseudomonadota bacterium]
MKTWATLSYQELKALLAKPTLPVAAGLWLLSFGLWTFFGGQFFENEEASLRAPLVIIPWLLALFIPILATELWHPTRRPGLEEWLHSLGLSGFARISAQAMAASFLSGLFILSSLPMTLTVMLLGQLDIGLWLASLLGLLCLAAWQLCLCGCILRFFQKPWIGGLCCCLLLLVLQGIGLPSCLDQLNHFFPLVPSSLLSATSPLTHFETIHRGIIDSRDLLYFVGGTFWFLAGQIFLQRKQRSISLRGKYTPPIAFWLLLDVWLLGGFALICFGQRSFVRLDLSDEKLYTLSEGSQSLLKKIKEPIHISLYFSQSHPQMETILRLHGQRIEELLEAYASVAHDQITMETIDPKPDTPAEAAARLEGLKGLRSTPSDIYLGAVFTMGAKSLKIPFFDPRKETQIEYELSEALVKLAQKNKPSLGIISPLPLASDRGESGSNLRPDWAVIAALRSLYQITRLPMESMEIPEGIASLLLVHPKNISEATEFAIDQFLLRGGHLIIAVDPFCETELAYNNFDNSNTSGKLSSGLPNLFSAWGVSFSSKSMLGDLSRGSRKVTLQQSNLDPFQINLQGNDLNREHQITRTLQQLFFSEAGWFDIKADPSKKWEVLVQSSAQSGFISTEKASYMSPQQLAQELKSDGIVRAVAGILTSQWKTAFPQKPSNSPLPGHIQQSANPSSIVLIADVDFLADPNAVEKLQVMNQMLIRPRNDNVGLITHAVEYLGGNVDLISIPKSGRQQRSLSRLLAIDETARQPWQAAEASLSARIDTIERQISELMAQEENTTSLLSKDQERELQNLRASEAGLWTERRLIRDKAHWVPDTVRRLILIVHLFIVPGVLFLVSTWMQSRHIYLRRSAD